MNVAVYFQPCNPPEKDFMQQKILGICSSTMSNRISIRERTKAHAHNKELVHIPVLDGRLLRVQDLMVGP